MNNIVQMSNRELDQLMLARDFEREGAPDPDLAEMNEKFAVVKLGGKARVISFEDSPAYPNCQVPVFSSFGDFTAFHDKRKKIELREDGSTRKIGIGKWWIRHEERRQYDGIVYAPNSEDPTKLNLWRGFACDPLDGDCDLYLAHLRDNICSGNVEHSEYLLDWMAYAAQHRIAPAKSRWC
jgi:hypothetical protein